MVDGSCNTERRGAMAGMGWGHNGDGGKHSVQKEIERAELTLYTKRKASGTVGGDAHSKAVPPSGANKKDNSSCSVREKGAKGTN